MSGGISERISDENDRYSEGIFISILHFAAIIDHLSSPKNNELTKKKKKRREGNKKPWNKIDLDNIPRTCDWRSIASQLNETLFLRWYIKTMRRFVHFSVFLLKVYTIAIHNYSKPFGGLEFSVIQ